MKKLLFVFVLLFSISVIAGDLEEGIKAYNNKEYVKALPLLKSVAKLGNNGAKAYLATMYANGLGVKKDLPQAFALHKEVAENTNLLYSMRILGVMYENGYGITKNMKEAVKWYTKAANKGEKSAQVSLGNIYYAGKSVKVDKKKAYYYWLLASKQGDAQAKNNLKYLCKQSPWACK